MKIARFIFYLFSYRAFIPQYIFLNERLAVHENHYINQFMIISSLIDRQRNDLLDRLMFYKKYS